MTSSDLPRIFCSLNDPWFAPDQYDLRLPLSQRDLDVLGDKLRDGIRVVLYEPDEFEVEGVLHFNSKAGGWIGTADWSTITYYY